MKAEKGNLYHTTDRLSRQLFKIKKIKFSGMMFSKPFLIIKRHLLNKRGKEAKIIDIKIILLKTINGSELNSQLKCDSNKLLTVQSFLLSQ
jgi:hypothetical protein